MPFPERVFRVTPGTSFASGVTISGTGVTFTRDGKLRISIAVDVAAKLNMAVDGENLPFNKNADLAGSNAPEVFEIMVNVDDPISFNFTGAANVIVRYMTGHLFADE